MDRRGRCCWKKTEMELTKVRGRLKMGDCGFGDGEGVLDAALRLEVVGIEGFRGGRLETHESGRGN